MRRSHTEGGEGTCAAASTCLVLRTLHARAARRRLVTARPSRQQRQRLSQRSERGRGTLHHRHTQSIPPLAGPACDSSQSTPPLANHKPRTGRQDVYQAVQHDASDAAQPDHILPNGTFRLPDPLPPTCPPPANAPRQGGVQTRPASCRSGPSATSTSAGGSRAPSLQDLRAPSAPSAGTTRTCFTRRSHARTVDRAPWQQQGCRSSVEHLAAMRRPGLLFKV